MSMNAKAKAISFSPVMIEALMKDLKSETRRILKHQPGDACTGIETHNGKVHFIYGSQTKIFDLPFKAGDILYVREAYYQLGHWEKDNSKTLKSGRQSWKFVPDSDTVTFEKPESFRTSMFKNQPSKSMMYRRLGRFMPKKYARTLLEVVSVEAERLQQISDEDAINEGISGIYYPRPKGNNDCWKIYGTHGGTSDPRKSFKSLWISINGNESWESNPVVAVIKFRRVEP